MPNLEQILLVGVILTLTFWRRDIILYLISFPLMIGFGLSWYDQYHTNFGFITALVLMGIGVYCLALGVVNMLEKARKKAE